MPARRHDRVGRAVAVYIRNRRHAQLTATDGVVGIAVAGHQRDQGGALLTIEGEASGKMRGKDRRDLAPSIAVEVGDAERIQPAMRPSNRRCGRAETDVPAGQLVKYERRPPLHVAPHHQELVVPVAVDVDDANPAVLEHVAGAEADLGIRSIPEP